MSENNTEIQLMHVKNSIRKVVKDWTSERNKLCLLSGEVIVRHIVHLQNSFLKDAHMQD